MAHRSVCYTDLDMSEFNRNQPPDISDLTKVKLPNGELVGFSEMLAQKDLGSTRTPTALLRSGDAIAMQFAQNSGTQGLSLFRVEEAEWVDLDILGDFCPRLKLTGELQGSDLPQATQGRKAVFVGTSFAGPIDQSALQTGRSFHFSATSGSEFRTPPITKFMIFRKDDHGEVRVVDQNQVSAESRTENETHQRRLSQIDELMKSFSFGKYNFKDCSKTIPNRLKQLTHADKRYFARYSANMAIGNSLTVMDKQTLSWIEFRYLNYKNEDVLQIGLADLPDLKTLSSVATHQQGINMTGAAITTFVTSPNLGIEAVTYKVSETDSTEIFGVAPYEGFIPRPVIHFLPDGQVNAPLIYPISEVEKRQPGFRSKVQQGARLARLEDGSQVMTLNGQERKLRDSDSEISQLLQYMEQVKSESYRARFVTRVGQVLGKLKKND